MEYIAEENARMLAINIVYCVRVYNAVPRVYSGFIN